MKKIAIIITSLLIILCIACFTFSGFFLYREFNQELNPDAKDTKTICEDPEFVSEIRNAACKNLEHDANKREFLSTNIISRKYKIGELYIYHASIPGVWQGVSFEDLYLQYQGVYVGKYGLKTEDWNHGFNLSSNFKLIHAENTDSIFVHFHDPHSYRENFELLEFNKTDGKVYSYDLTKFIKDFELLKPGYNHIYETYEINTEQQSVTLRNMELAKSSVFLAFKKEEKLRLPPPLTY